MSAVTASSSTNMFSQAVDSQAGGDTLGKEDFMLLLVTQFQYQDPLNPMEDKEFIAQLAQFSSLEQLMNLNTSMEGLTQATYSQEMINATSFIGKTVDVTGSAVSKVTDSTTGEVKVSGMIYALGEAAVSGGFNVFDANGELVASYDVGPKAAGSHPFTWDGMTSYGTPAPDGVYTLMPAFTNADGQPITGVGQVVDGLVTGVVTDNGVTHLYLSDGRSTPLYGVQRVSELTTISNGTTDTTDPDNSGSGSTDNTEPEETKPEETTP